MGVTGANTSKYSICSEDSEGNLSTECQGGNHRERTNVRWRYGRMSGEKERVQEKEAGTSVLENRRAGFIPGQRV